MEAEPRRRPGDGITRPFGPVGLLELIEPRVRALAADDLGIDPEELTARASLSDDLAVDSLELTELVVRIEAELGISVPERAIAHMRTYGDLITVILARVVAAMSTWESAPTPFRAVATTAQGTATVHRAGVLDPYVLDTLLADARHGGGRLEVTVPEGTETAVRTLLASLARWGVAVTVTTERDDAASAAA
jgi:acyl carrier protein